MDKIKIINHTDHTYLKQFAVWEDIKLICDEAVEFGAASVCIPPSFVKRASDYLAGRVPVCTVIGFPNGYSTAEVKAFETKNAVQNGADEIDMVINIGDAKSHRYDEILAELKLVRAACPGKILKVIIETCYLDRDEKTALCGVVSASGADYIKTSTGFGTAGASAEDIELFREHIAPHVKIKAAGGIRTFEDAERLMELGADRIGASALIKLMK